MAQRRGTSESESADTCEIREPFSGGPALSDDDLAQISQAVTVIDDPEHRAIAWDILTRYKATFDYLKDK